MAKKRSETFSKYRKQMMKAAIELGYGMVVVNRIENATTHSELSDIMYRARHESMAEDKWEALDKK